MIITESRLIALAAGIAVLAGGLSWGQRIAHSGTPVADVEVANLDQIGQVQRIFRSREFAQMTSIELTQDSLIIEAELARDAQGEIPLLLQELSKLSPLKLASVATALTDRSVRLEIKCTRPEDPSQRLRGQFSDLGNAIDALFPDDKIELTILPSSVVLRGEVSPEKAEQAVSIAEQFYPNVINQMHWNGASIPTVNGLYLLGEQLTELHSDVKHLRKEVRRLIGVMQSEARNQVAPGAAVSQLKSESPTPWKVTFSEVLKMALENHPKASETEELRICGEVSELFEQLNSTQHELQSISARGAYQRDLEAYFTEAVSTDTSPPSDAPAQDANRKKNLERLRQQTESRLRELMGLPREDGRRILPTYQVVP